MFRYLVASWLPIWILQQRSYPDFCHSNHSMALHPAGTNAPAAGPLRHWPRRASCPASAAAAPGSSASARSLGHRDPQQGKQPGTAGVSKSSRVRNQNVIEVTVLRYKQVKQAIKLEDVRGTTRSEIRSRSTTLAQPHFPTETRLVVQPPHTFAIVPNPWIKLRRGLQSIKLAALNSSSNVPIHEMDLTLAAQQRISVLE